jgi:hypothetical protein
MGLFSRSSEARNRVDSARLADFGRLWLLREESGLDPTKALEALDGIRKPLYYQPDGDQRAGEELRRHAADGEWKAIGAWQFASDFVRDEELEDELRDLALLALMKMRITNLSIHLPAGAVSRYEELTQGPVPEDGYWGPPAFDSDFGPTRAEREAGRSAR